ncbi:hypothetical protein SUDANB95_05827 [Actinosynnema sp. ALI-1.44]
MIDESVTIDAPPSEVWRALVSPEGRRAHLADLKAWVER